MSASHQLAFVHHLVVGNPGLTQSVCPLCGEFVGASKNPGNLRIAEAAHACPGVPVPGPGLVILKLKRSH